MSGLQTKIHIMVSSTFLIKYFSYCKINPREVVWNEVFEVWNTLDLVFEDLRKLFSEEPTSLRYIYEILWILGENS